MGFRLEEIFFRSTLGELTQRWSDMRETQHEPAVEIGKTEKLRSTIRVVGVVQSQVTCILGGSTCTYWTWAHYVPQILNLGPTKSAFLEIGTQLMLSQGLEDLPNMV